MSKHCRDNAADRKLGEYWERAFCIMAGERGRSYTPQQIGRTASAQAYLKQNGKYSHWTLPDVTVWTYPGEHHEIKHKSPTGGGRFGLERYRYDALAWFANETQQQVYYTIHRWDLAGEHSTENHIEHWVTISVEQLEEMNANGRGQLYNANGDSRGNSYVNGQKKNVAMYFWPARAWEPLASLWRPDLYRCDQGLLSLGI